MVNISKLKSQEFKRNGYSTRYKELKTAAKLEIKDIRSRKINEAVADAGGSNSWLSRMEALLDPDGCSERMGNVLPEHKERGLSPLEQAEDYALHISSISREYVPQS